MNQKWLIQSTVQEEELSHLKQLLIQALPNYHTEIFCQLLAQRNVKTKDDALAYFYPDRQKEHDPFLMLGMNKAVNRIKEALGNNEKILLFGDYDVDGTTSVALVYRFLKSLTENVDYYIPDRIKEGYGISKKGIDHASSENFNLIITLDCGISAKEKVDYANSLGIDVIICDHHKPPDILPSAFAILNPKQTDCVYPYKELSGCGVGYKLCQAVYSKFPSAINPKSLLGFLALSIACDIVDVTGENRLLLAEGIKQLENNPITPLKALITSSGIQIDEDNKVKSLTVRDLVFGIGPRINAAGRLAHASFAVELLVEDDFQKASERAKWLNKQNSQRQKLHQSVLEEAEHFINVNIQSDAYSLVLYDEEWHKGVIGIVASKIVDKYQKPTIILTKDGEYYTGSARSIAGINLYEAIKTNEKHLLRFGGHEHAAGLTLSENAITNFSIGFEKAIRNQIAANGDQKGLYVDAEVKFKDFLSDKEGLIGMRKILKNMEPFGPGNMNPTFSSKDVIVHDYSSTMKGRESDKEHLKLYLYQEGMEYSIEAVAFGFGYLYDELMKHKRIDLAYHIEWNTFQGQNKLQLRILAIQLSA